MSQSSADIVWLEASGCWARIPDLNKTGFDKDYQKEPKRRRLLSPLQGQNGFAVDAGECSERCPICLDRLELNEKAVVTPCMHHYHFRCLGRWIAGGKQACPMCRCTMLSILHDIQDEENFKEEELGSPNNVSMLARLSEAFGMEEQPRAPHIRMEAGTQVEIPSGAHRRSTWRSRNASQSHHRIGSNRHSVTERSGGCSPYSLRLQRYLCATFPQQSSVQNQSVRDEGTRNHDEGLQRRRRIYGHNLWAIPLHSTAGAESIRRMLRHWGGRQRRLIEWIDRELMAILSADDTSLIRSFVLGVLQAHGSAEEEELASQEPITLLEPFLSEHSAHFWHELNCFAFAPAYTIETYDRLVKYRKRGAAPTLTRGRSEGRRPHQNLAESNVRDGDKNISSNPGNRWRMWQPGDPLQ